MTSPAEAHAERLAEERWARRKLIVTRQLDYLVKMTQDVGFGSGTSHNWVEREIFIHLEAVYNLLSMENRLYQEN